LLTPLLLLDARATFSHVSERGRLALHKEHKVMTVS
jgi:hypothetical protein